MSAQAPWWFTGSEQAGKPTGDPEAKSGFELPGFDIGGLASGAQLVVDWARESLVTSHQGHLNPQDHPQCLMCRAMGLLHPSPVAHEPQDAPEIEWIRLDPPTG